MSFKLLTSILPKRGVPIGVGVSMGVDSIAAYLYLYRHGHNVIPIHFNHNLRPQNMFMQMRFVAFVKQISKDFGSSVTGYTNMVDDQIQSGSENECRNRRLEFFRSICTANKIQHIVTGHHLNDYVESYLLNCLRGKAEHQPIKLTTDFGEYKIIHPFLLNEKKRMEEYVDVYDGGKYLEFVVTDETNSVNKGSRRNWIRNIVVPELKSQQISLNKFCRNWIEKVVDRSV